MTAPTITDYLKYANLQMAAEAFLVDSQEKPLTGQLYIDALVRGNTHASKFTQTQATAFATQWEVVDQRANTSTGFSGTLFRNKANPTELVISFRSTEFIDDAVRDSLATNELEIKNTGFAWGQIADMEAWYADLNSNPAKLAGKAFSVTGYSLGGHLSTAFGILRGEAGDQGVIKHIYTYNGAGIGDDVVTGDAGADKLYGEEGNDWRQRVTHKSRRWRDGDSCSGSANQDTWRTAA